MEVFIEKRGMRTQISIRFKGLFVILTKNNMFLCGEVKEEETWVSRGDKL